MSNAMSRGSLTTLQLARRIATAVLATRDTERHFDSTRDAPTQAVLRTLRSTGTWFMAGDQDEHGITIAKTERPLPAARTRRPR